MKLFRLLLLLMLTLSVNTITAQKNINGYKYIFIPTLKYPNGQIDIWNIGSMLTNMFQEKGFTVINESGVDDLKREGICLGLELVISHTNVEIGVNKVTINLKNCRDEIVYSGTGSAMGLSVQDDFNKGTRRAFDGFKKLSYSFDPTQTPELKLGKVDVTNETEYSLKDYFDKNSLDPIEGFYKSYQDEYLGYYKLGIKKLNGKYAAILIETDQNQWKPGEVKAYFELSSMRGLYSTTWFGGDKTKEETFATLENNSILSIEFKMPDKSKKTSKLLKTYPSNTLSDNQTKDIKKVSSGSGFFISADGFVATNAHVIEGAKNITIKFTNELGVFSYKAKVELKDGKNDVAILKIDDINFKVLNSIPYEFIEKAEIGERTFTIGYPLNDIMGTNFKLTDGIVSSNSGIGDDLRFYQITVPIQPGNSGGPLFNSQGNIVGLTTGKLNSKAVGTPTENVNYAIKIQYLLNIANMLPNQVIQKSTGELKGKELKDQVKILKNYVCLMYRPLNFWTKWG